MVSSNRPASAWAVATTTMTTMMVAMTVVTVINRVGAAATNSLEHRLLFLHNSCRWLSLAQQSGHFSHGWFDIFGDLGVGRTEIIQIEAVAF